MRRWLVLASVAVQMLVGLTLIAVPAFPFWSRAALGIFLCGIALRWTAVDHDLVHLREVLGLSPIRGLRFAYSAYACAGAFAIVAAFSSLPLVLAVIVAPFVTSWVVLWVWAIRRSTLRHRPTTNG